MQFFKRTTTQHVPSQHVPWNKGKLTGQKPPLQLKHVGPFEQRYDSMVAFGI